MNFFKFKSGLFPLIFACSFIIFACGSDNSSGISSSRKDKKAPEKQNPKVVEMLIGTSPGKDATRKPVIPREMGSPNFEVIPPEKPGESGVTQQEVDAALRAQKTVDSQDFEVIPPSKPGERGITQREIDAAVRTSKPIDAEDFEVTPPSKPGERGMTQRELDAALRASKPTDPQDFEVIPPRQLEGRGVTQQGSKRN